MKHVQSLIIIPQREKIGSYDDMKLERTDLDIIPQREKIGSYDRVPPLASRSYNYTTTREDRELRPYYRCNVCCFYYTTTREDRELRLRSAPPAAARHYTTTREDTKESIYYCFWFCPQFFTNITIAVISLGVNLQCANFHSLNLLFQDLSRSTFSHSVRHTSR